MGKRTVILFLLPFLFLAIFYAYFFSYVNSKNQQRVMDLALAQAKINTAFIEVAGKHLLEEGEENLENFLSRLMEDEEVVYVAVEKKGKLTFWDSKYPGYLPIQKRTSPRIFPSPIGSILEMRGEIGEGVFVYLGIDFSLLDEIKKRSFVNFLVVFSSLLLFSALSFAYILYVNHLYFKKEEEVFRERQEKERFRELSLLTSSLSHELKNPINNLYLNLQLLERKLREDDLARYLSRLKQEARRLSDIVETHLSLIKLSPHREKVKLKDLLPLEYPLVLHLEVDKDLELETDPKLFRLILSNLLRNSAEAGAKNVWLRWKERRLEVEDDAGGVGQEHLETLFEPFYSGKKEGSGIGLALVRRVAEALGIKIKAENGENGLKIIMEFKDEDSDN